MKINMNKKLDNLIPVVDSKLLKAKSYGNENTMNFSFFTDPHISDSSTYKDIDILNYINSNMDIEFTACCGDNLDNAESKQAHLATAEKLMKKITFHKFFTVKGNHDDNSIISNGVDNIRYTMLPQEQYNIMFKNLEDIVKFDSSNEKGLYYFYDVPQFKVRAIFLNSIDIPYTVNPLKETAWKYDGQNNYAYSNSQLNWLAHTALKLPNSDWKIMFFTHINPFLEGMIGADYLVHNGSVMLDIIDAFSLGTKYASIATSGDFAQEVSVDFTLQGCGTVLAFFYGHTHSEQVLTRKGIKYISTWNDVPRKSSSNPQAPNRMIGTITEVCLNVVTIDFSENKLFITKFGVGEDLVINIE